MKNDFDRMSESPRNTGLVGDFTRKGTSMWLITKFGFFSVVQKPGDSDLTVRSRVLEDLEQLREQYLPELGEIEEGKGTDYRFRAKASHEAVAETVRKITLDIDYSNFKNEVKRVQGSERAGVYGEVWTVLYHLQK